MDVRVKDRAHWLLGYGLSRWLLKLGARSGDPFARLLIDSNQPQNVYELAEQLRRRGRLSPTPGGGWVTADARIVRDVLRDSSFRTVKQHDRSLFRVVQWLLAKTDPHVLNPVEPPSLLVLDPPEHARLRRLVARAFTPRAIDGLHHRIQEITDTLLDELAGRSHCDLIDDYASQIPIAVIAEMLGIPRDETPYVYSLADPISKLLSSTAPSWRDFQTATAALREYERFLDMHIARLAGGGADTSILSAVVRDGDLTDVEVKMLAGLLLGGGFLTTAHAFGNAVVALVEHPDQLARLRAEPAGWPNAVEEALRYDSVLQITARVATETVQIDGQTLRAGAAIFLLGGGANRDPAVFAHPDEFDTTRANAREHIGFGSGVHACLGATLARMELHVGLKGLFERFPQLTLAGDPTPSNSTLLHGFKHVPINLGLAKVPA